MDKKEKIQKLKYISMSLMNGNYSLLGNTISEGKVFKIPFRGNLEEDMFEKGFLFIPKGSSIKMHKHINDIELYLLIRGDLSVKGQEVSENMCFLGEEHNIDPVSSDTFIETFKISKKYLDKVSDEYNQDRVKVLCKVYSRLENEISL